MTARDANQNEDDEIKVDSGVPMPPRNSAAAKYPWRAMGVGDSFFVPINDADPERRGDVSLRRAATEVGRRLGVKFSARIVTESGIRGLRVWRVE